MRFTALLLLPAVLLVAGCEEQQSTLDDPKWTLAISVFGTNATPTTAATWELDEDHYFEWDGGGTESWEIGCSVEEDGLQEIFSFYARDELWLQGLELSMSIEPFSNDGNYELWPDDSDPPFDLSLVTTEQTYDLETRSTGRCTVKVASGLRFGDFSCDQLMEYVTADHQELPFTVTGNWECAEVVADG